MDLSKESFDEWKAHPVTKVVMAEIQSVKTELMKQLSEGLTLGHTAEVTHGLTHKLVGQIEGLNQLLNISFVDAINEDTVNSVSGY